MSEEVTKALLLMEPPTSASQTQVERAIVSARGNVSAAAEVSKSACNVQADVSQRLNTFVFLQNDVWRTQMDCEHP